MSTDLESAIAVLDLEIQGLQALRTGLNGDFRAVAALLKTATGKIIVTGMGKSGHVARKIAATLSSTGAPAMFVHPGEASHGDLGMISPGDCILALSKSGETPELGDLLAYAKRFSIPVAAITFGLKSTLANAASAAIILPNVKEACEVTRAPTTSTTMMIALGDALAVALLRSKGFTAGDFHSFHPGGNLGAALRRVRHMMHGPDVLPLCQVGVTLEDAVKTLNDAGFGCVGFVDDKERLVGMLTDGDLRRRFGAISADQPAASVMTQQPKVAHPDMLAGDALAMLSKGKITALFVVEDEKPVGLLHVHDCLTTGVL
ncbi:MAG: KpsF/GutQ family sugar-phosphate isomerase [Parvularculaceae bacterium]